MAERAPSFPVPWIVIPPVVAFLVLAAIAIAQLAGIQMLSHGTSEAGVIVLVMAVATVAVAGFVEVVALVAGLVALWRSPSLRSAKNYSAIAFAVVAVLAFLAAIEVPHRW